MNDLHPDAKVIEKLGGTAAVSRIFGIRMPSVSNMKRRGIPEYRRIVLALLYPDIVPKAWVKSIMDRKELTDYRGD